MRQSREFAMRLVKEMLLAAAGGGQVDVAAVLVRAFGRQPFVEKLVDATDSNIRTIGKALIAANRASRSRALAPQ